MWFDFDTYSGAVYTRFAEAALAEITPELLLSYAIIFSFPLVMAFLSLTLKDSINRWANIIVGIVFAVLPPISLIGFPTAHSAYSTSVTLIATAEFVAAALIVWYAWKSKQKA